MSCEAERVISTANIMLGLFSVDGIMSWCFTHLNKSRIMALIPDLGWNKPDVCWSSSRFYIIDKSCGVPLVVNLKQPFMYNIFCD